MNRLSPLLGLVFSSFVVALLQPGCAASDSTETGSAPLADKPGNGQQGGGSTDFCKGGGATIPLPGGDLCTGDLGKKLFRFATCSCKTTSVAGVLTTDSFNSSTGQDKRNGASVGANEKLTDMGGYSIGGSVYVGKTGDANGMGFQGAGAGKIAYDIWSGKDVSLSGVVQVGRDIHATGDVSALGIGSVGGTAHLSAGNSIHGFMGAKTVTENVNIENPCDCEKKVDVPAIVSNFKSTNDNAVAHIDANTFANRAGVQSMTLPCGKYYLSSVGGSGVTKIRAEGRVAMFVAGDFNVAGAFDIDLADNAEIDLFIAGDFNVAGATAFGSVAKPSKVRVYVGGQNFRFAGAMAVGGNFYAPNATVSLASAFAMSGSIFADTLQMGGAFTIHYDEAILDTQGCKPPPPPGGCKNSDDCGGQACVNGTCGACTVDEDCSSPLYCVEGKCVNIVH
ncbi:hypothetical protein LZC95_04275 [Pendulispora brunnea]|uniref:DUF7305 domain-containing protein n=1 Tax=Pendulispora brunnea TaxID=2905690 RepID=A0ABZ2KEQ3_9BACT